MINNMIKSSTCYILCGNYFGTGHLIARDKVLTARHCVLDAIDDGKPIELTFPETSEDNGELKIKATVIAHTEEYDTCLLLIEGGIDRQFFTLESEFPREGIEWLAYGFPKGKTEIGHYLKGTVVQTLHSPKAKTDVDLAVDVNTSLDSYKGYSGAAVVCGNKCKGVLRVKHNGTIGAISIRSLKPFLLENEIELIDEEFDEDSLPNLAQRTEFQSTLEKRILDTSSSYIFLEGAPGIGKTTFTQNYMPIDPSIINVGTYCILDPKELSNISYKSEPNVFFEWLLIKISSLITGKVAPFQRRQYQEIISETSSLLKSLSEYCELKNEHAIILVDGLNEINESEPPRISNLIGILPKTLPNNISVVFSAPNYQQLKPQIALEISNDNVLSIPQLSDETCLAYCFAKTDPQRVSVSLVNTMVQKAKGHPLFLNYLINYVNEHPEDQSLNDFPMFDGDIKQYYENIWDRLLLDDNAIHLLAIIARLRWKMKYADFHKALESSEKQVFTPTISRIKHLLLEDGFTEIYHSSFKEFLISKTSHYDEDVHHRMGIFCMTEREIDYCGKNVVYHYLHGNEEDQIKAINLCDQSWVDTCAEKGMAPDILLEDVNVALKTAVKICDPVQLIRILLLSHRVSFRYDTLFAQSARLFAEALIGLDRPKEALKHVVRYDILIVDPDEALLIAYKLIEHEYLDEALELLDTIIKMCSDVLSSNRSMDLEEYIHIATVYIRGVLFKRLCDGQSHMQEVQYLLHSFLQDIRETLSGKDPLLLEMYESKLISIGNGYFLTCCDSYVSISDFNTCFPDMPNIDWQVRLKLLTELLLDHDENVETLGLCKERNSLGQIFSDLIELHEKGVTLDDQRNILLIDFLIRNTAPSSLVLRISEDQYSEKPIPISLRTPNGVDANISGAYESGIMWRVFGYTNTEEELPQIPGYNNEEWLLTFERLLEAIFIWEGKSRRASVDEDDAQREITNDYFTKTILPALNISLDHRARWHRSYAIPEEIIPFAAVHVFETILDCSPDLVDDFLSNLNDRSFEQLGLYTEGYRACIFRILFRLTRYDYEKSTRLKALTLLKVLRDHVIDFVENRHELIPGLLMLITLFTKLGANEEAEKLYKILLGVSMGPTWYKEDQFGLLTCALKAIPDKEIVSDYLPNIAEYLDIAAGEMTFQRYVRYDKAELIACLFQHNLSGIGIRYIQQQLYGDRERLLIEWKKKDVDKLSTGEGNRHLGISIDEQDVILRIVDNITSVDWRLRWALLEIFNFGDPRYVCRFAVEFANIVNEVGETVEFVKELSNRITIIISSEVPEDDVSSFTTSFIGALDDKHVCFFPKIRSTYETYKTEEKLDSHTSPIRTKAQPINQSQKSRTKDEFHYPGLFAKQSSIEEAQKLIDSADDQIELGNISAALKELVEALQCIQNGGGSLWDYTTECSKDAERKMKELTDDASVLLNAYGPMILEEKHAPRWAIVRHLIPVFFELITEKQRKIIIDNVIKHVGIIVNKYPHQLSQYKYYEAEQQDVEPSAEFFIFVTWLLNHPKWIRREKTASMLLWLVNEEFIWFEHATKSAFEMNEEISSDVLCGILDFMSNNDPIATWNKVRNILDLNTVIAKCEHVSRLYLLYRIANRAEQHGSSSGAEFSSDILSNIRAGAIVLDSTEAIRLPEWANCIGNEWRSLANLQIVTFDLLQSLTTNLEQLCAPHSILDIFKLESALSRSYGEGKNRPLNRWEGKVRFALNMALQPYISQKDFTTVGQILNICNPMAPDYTVLTEYKSQYSVVLDCLKTKGDFSSLIGDSESYFLHYLEIGSDENSESHQIEILALLLSSDQIDGRFFLPEIEAKFSSTELPNLDTSANEHETCFHVVPDFSFLGTFTPAIPVPKFVEKISAKETDFLRVNWKNGCSSDTNNYGRPEKQGCCLTVLKSSVNIPDGFKLVWIITVNNSVVSVVDEENNQFI